MLAASICSVGVRSMSPAQHRPPSDDVWWNSSWCVACTLFIVVSLRRRRRNSQARAKDDSSAAAGADADARCFALVAAAGTAFVVVVAKTGAHTRRQWARADFVRRALMELHPHHSCTGLFLLGVGAWRGQYSILSSYFSHPFWRSQRGEDIVADELGPSKRSGSKQLI